MYGDELVNRQEMYGVELVNRQEMTVMNSSTAEIRRVITARFTSRPEARGSGVEAVFRFLGSGVDFF